MVRLCLPCAKRQGDLVKAGHVKVLEDRVEECYICSGLLSRLDYIFNLLLDAVRDYEFNAFLIGCTLPYHIIEREDELRALLKVRGHESIKGNISRELGKMLTAKGYRVDYVKPDIDIHVHVKDIDADVMDVSIKVKARPIYLSAVYTKSKRGIAQKGLKDSIESMVRDWLKEELGCDDVRFSWVGGEDRDSLVFNGRPFFMKVINARRRLRSSEMSRDGIHVRILERVNTLPSNVRFLTNARLHLSCRDASARDRVILLNNLAVRFREGRKDSIRRIHEARVSSISNNGSIMDVDILIDGGFMVKRFAEGIDAEPSMKDMLGDVTLEYFDILEVIIQDKVNYVHL